MTPTNDQSEKNRGLAFSLTLATVTGQVGCLTLIIVLAALFGGLWLDNTFHTKPAFTIGLMVGSVPITIIMMFWVVRSATSRLTAHKRKNDTTQEESNRGKTS
jgi:F0F1-type ATP synthase assembly protein I